MIAIGLDSLQSPVEELTANEINWSRIKQSQKIADTETVCS